MAHSEGEKPNTHDATREQRCQSKAAHCKPREFGHTKVVVIASAACLTNPLSTCAGQFDIELRRQKVGKEGRREDRDENKSLGIEGKHKGGCACGLLKMWAQVRRDGRCQALRV